MSDMIIKLNCTVYNCITNEHENIDFYLPFNFSDNKNSYEEYYFDKFSLRFPYYQVESSTMKEVIILDE